MTEFKQSDRCLFLPMKLSPEFVDGFFRTIILLVAFYTAEGTTSFVNAQEQKLDLKVGVYYFDGWAGKNRLANDPNEPWARNAPTNVTRRMIEEFSDREPVWGWRDDDLAVMERQIDLAAENGVNFFLFCWYWKDNNGPINLQRIKEIPHHTSLNLYMKAKNRNKVKYGFLVANHEGSEIKGPENWLRATEYWDSYFNDSQYITVENKPLLVVFNTSGIDNESLIQMQEASKRHGLKGLSIAGCNNTWGKSFNYRTHYNVIPGYTSGAEEHKYAELADSQKKEWNGTKEQPYIPTVIVGWDKRPWEDMTRKGQGGSREGWYYPDHTPEQFKNLLTDAVSWMDRHPEETTRERLLLVYAWNELGEGGYLIPTKGDPEASFLKKLKEVALTKRQNKSN